MGCVFGKRRFQPNNLVEGQDENALEIITRLGFTPSDVDLLYTAFWDIDADGSGLIRPAELFAYFEVEGTPFERKIFALFDEDQSGVINFVEFVCTLWNILTLPQGDFGSVAFLLRDPTGRNKITYADIRIIIEMLHNRKLDKDPSLNSVYLQMKKELDIKVAIHDFNRWTAGNPTIVAPLVMLQLHLRLQIIGERFWIRLSNLRKNDEQQCQLDYVKRLQESVTEKNRIFREKQEAEEAERRRLSRIGRNVQHYNAKDNIARKESKLLGYFNMKSNKSSLTRVIPEQKVLKSDHKNFPLLEENEEGEGKNLTDHHSQHQHHALSSTNTVTSNKSRGNSADLVESNDLLLMNKMSSNKNTPIIFKYDNPDEPPAVGLFGQPNKSKKKENDGNGISNKISNKPSDKKKKNLRQEYQLTVNKKKRKSSLFDIFASSRKLNYDVLDEADEEHLSKPREVVPIRRRRSVLKKPNLIKKD